MKKGLLLSVFAGLFFLLSAQTARERTVQALPFWQNPSSPSEGRWQPRPEFISYEVRDHADRGNPDRDPHYLPLEGKWRVNYSTAAEGGVKDFYKPDYLVASWGETDVPNFRTVPDAANPLANLVPPQLPAEIPLVQYRAEIDIPYLWLDRDMFIYVENAGGAHVLYINDRKVGYSTDSRTPAQYNISDYVTNGYNSIGIEVYGFGSGSWLETLLPQPVAGSLGKVYLFSQPKLRVEDFVISAKPDTTGKHTWLDIRAVLSNSYNSGDSVSLGYDVYLPGDKKAQLITYNKIPVALRGNGHDTVYYREIIYNTTANNLWWTPDTPRLYEFMFYIQRGNRIVEYIPLEIGFTWREMRDGELWVNGKKADLRAANYNAAANIDQTQKDLQALKKNKINTIYVSYPQPEWFYMMCDRVGLWVVDQANINSGYRTGDRNVGGSLANDPRFLPAFIDRVAYMQGRSKNHPSVIALSMGGNSGNGYNFYKAYQWLKQADTLRPVIYRDVQGEWNSDLQLPEAANASQYLQ